MAAGLTEPPPFEKNFYMEHPAVTGLSDAEVKVWRDRHKIVVSDPRAPNPVRTFIEAAFPEHITAECEAAGFDAPTAIQSQSWPIALSGFDMIGLASTGSGKTLGFALPALVHILVQDYLEAGDGPIALMLAPTRELAVQIKTECDKFGASSGVKNTAVYGGVPKGPQLRDLQQGIEIAIATPGRLLDFLDAGQTNLRRTSYVVLDEADRMLDLGFEPQLRRILERTRPERQTLMWSATWPREVQALAREFLKQPVMVTVNNASHLTASRNVSQHFEVCSGERWNGVSTALHTAPLHTAPFTLRPSHCAPSHCALHTAPFTVRPSHCALHTAPFTVRPSQCALPVRRYAASRSGTVPLQRSCDASPMAAAPSSSATPSAAASTFALSCAAAGSLPSRSMVISHSKSVTGSCSSSRAVARAFSSRPTWPRAASTSKTCGPSSTTRRPPRYPMHTCTCACPRTHAHQLRDAIAGT